MKAIAEAFTRDSGISLHGVEASAVKLSGAGDRGKGAFSFNHLWFCADREVYPVTVTAMNLPLHLLRLQPAPTERSSESVHVATPSDVHSSKPLFRAPALPTPHQLSNELPFTVNYRPRLRERP